mgnify:CR=1 FL=1
MKKRYVLVRLRAETVEDLKRLRSQMAKPSINELIVTMIQITDSHLSVLKNTGWQDFSNGGVMSCLLYTSDAADDE